ncbi:MAG: methyltransferase [Firmicutes bacterium]|nr:methyltransferase [[Eubacterium] siraeum]MCM1487902.1 methyltransferase [Bacillota bacterium]
MFVPVLGETFDMFISLEAPMYEILELVKKGISKMSYGRFLANEDTVICYRDNGNIVNINLSVYELNIVNGTKLMLI